MRNVTILRVAMPLAVMAVLVWAAPANAGEVLYETGFETVDGFTPGGTIRGVDGWDIDRYATNPVDVTTETTNPISGSMSMCTTNAPNSRPFYDPAPPEEIRIIVCTFKARLATNTNEMLTYVGGGGSSGAIAYFGTDGKIYAYDGPTVLKNPDGSEMTYEADTVYGVRMMVDIDDFSYDVYIDSGSGFVLGGEGFSHGAPKIEWLFFNVYGVATDVDDVSIVGIDPGDANFNGTVDDSDLNLLLTGWGTGTSWDEGDFNKDDLVNDSDLNLLLTNWTYPPAGSVPEPATIGLLAFGAIALVRRRRRA